MAKYRVNDINPTLDGTADVTYDITALDDETRPMPDKRVFIRVPADEVAAAEALPTDPERNAAHKALLIQYAPGGWSSADLDTEIINNLAAKEASDQVNERLTFPLTYTL